MKLKLSLVIAAIALAALIIPVGFALAASADTVTTIYACQDTTTNAVTQIATVAPTCASGTSSVQWNVIGPQGDPGAPGLSKYAVVHTHEVAANPGQIVSANCPAGDVVLGGGAAVDGTSSNFALSVSRPSDPHHAWQAAYSSNNGKHTRISVWATCAVVA